MMVREKNFYRQYAALPFRVMHGELLVLLITSRETQRWVLPKGWPEKRRKPHEVAANEAFEEAGLKGEIARTPIAAFEYDKVMEDGRKLPCLVDVYPLRVTKEVGEWRERTQRRRVWMRPQEAAALVDEKDLRRLLTDFAAHPDQADFAD